MAMHKFERASEGDYFTDEAIKCSNRDCDNYTGVRK